MTLALARSAPLRLSSGASGVRQPHSGLAVSGTEQRQLARLQSEPEPEPECESAADAAPETPAAATDAHSSDLFGPLRLAWRGRSELHA